MIKVESTIASIARRNPAYHAVIMIAARKPKKGGNVWRYVAINKLN